MACTEGQVFHNKDRENEAKTRAKVRSNVNNLFSFCYSVSVWMDLVLGAWFQTQNVPCVPSVFDPPRCLMVQVRAGMPFWAGACI
jgi:hypothetical protein